MVKQGRGAILFALLVGLFSFLAVTAQALADRLREFGHRGAEYVGTIDQAVETALPAAQPGDLVLTLGAGNVWQAGEQLLARLEEAQSAA